MAIALDDYLFDADREGTRAFYEKRTAPENNSEDWKQYQATIDHMHPFVRKIMGRFGIDLTKPQAIYSFEQDEETISYRGTYFMMGTMLQGRPCWEITKGENGTETHEFIGDVVHLGETFSAFFSSDAKEAPGGMPRPIIRMDYRIRLPKINN